jgi:hypothetical protein
MVAVKILDEGVLLHGSEEIFRAVNDIIRERGLDNRLAELEARAHLFRLRAETSNLDGSLDGERIRETHLFYSAEEFEELNDPDRRGKMRGEQHADRYSMWAHVQRTEFSFRKGRSS